MQIERKRLARDVLEDEDGILLTIANCVFIYFVAGEVYNYDNTNDESGYVPVSDKNVIKL